MVRIVLLIYVASLVSSNIVHDEDKPCVNYKISQHNLQLNLTIGTSVTTISTNGHGVDEVVFYRSTRDSCTSDIDTFPLANISTYYKTLNESLICSKEMTYIDKDLKINGGKVQMKGLVTSKNEITAFRLFCFSCTKPFGDHVEFFVNQISEDNVRLHNNKCYHKGGECIEDKCSCAENSYIYAWAYRPEIASLSYNFTCAMRFKSRESNKILEFDAHVLFNGTEFVERSQQAGDIVQQEKPDTFDDKETNSIIESPLLWTGIGFITFLVIMFGLTSTIYILMMRKKNKDARKRRHGDTEEIFSLLQSSGSDEILKHILCTTCQHLTAFAFCPVCGGFYCESCFEQHNVISDYKLIQIEHIPGTDHSTKCNTCDTLSTRVCITCEKLFCDSCSCNHKHKSLLLKSAVANRDSTVRNLTSRVEMTELYKVNLSKNNSHQHSDSEHIPDTTAGEHCDPTKKSDDNKSERNLHVRVFGIAFLSSDRFVVGDSHNRTLKVFQKHSLHFSFSLEKEPRGLAALYGDKVAVTFPHLRLIKMYDIKENCILHIGGDINLKKTGKPFSIAYNEDVFAVEINESEDGFIAILSFEGQVLYKIREATKYAYFTGHTSRLALDSISESVFITAMSKKSVTCLDFSGNKKWSKTIPSPRGLCFIPPGKLLVASKRGNAIYKVNSKTGDNDIIAAMGCIHGPRYITYDQKEKMLYVHVFDENDDNYIVVIKYNMLA